MLFNKKIRILGKNEIGESISNGEVRVDLEHVLFMSIKPLLKNSSLKTLSNQKNKNMFLSVCLLESGSGVHLGSYSPPDHHRILSTTVGFFQRLTAT
jgi:hypothetical protein